MQMLAIAIILAFASDSTNASISNHKKDAELLGDVLCAEGGAWIDGTESERSELAAIGQVAVNHVAFYDQPMRTGLNVKRRWAHGCPDPRLKKALITFASKVLTGRTDPPDWSKRALAFTTKAAARRVDRVWRIRGYRPIDGTNTIHVFWGKRLK